MEYISTRGNGETLSFKRVLIAGLAPDGGLYVPVSFPKFSKGEIASFAKLSYSELAYQIIKPFVGDEIPNLKKIIDETYSNWHHPAIAPLKQIGHKKWLLELFHGETLAFKDFALQLLGRLFQEVIQPEESINIIGATSGDTGSAAIHGCKNCANAKIFILHPHNRVSEVQRMQMTTIISPNIHNIAIKGNFDDAQNIVKELFVEARIPNLVAVNSINWARIMAQIVYYFYAAISLGAPHREISFAVPTGNFGDIVAGYYARKMGLPIKKLVIATNQNNILHRMLRDNDYSKKELIHSLSPSMDIQISSNFERLLYDLYQDPTEIGRLMQEFAKSSKLSIADKQFDGMRSVFASDATSDEEIIQIILDIYQTTGEIIDPHTATAIKAAENYEDIVILATAHPAKFQDAIIKSGVPSPQLPLFLSDLLKRKEEYVILDASKSEIEKYIMAAELQAEA